MKGITKIFSLFFVIVSITVNAQQNDTIKRFENYTRSFHYTYENDVFTSTDRYYTQGSFLELRHPVFQKSPFSRILIKINQYKSNSYGLKFRQDVYTPKTILNKTLDSTDRPYAGTMFFSQTLVSTGMYNKLSTSLDIGVIGPAALGEEQQKFIHKHTRNDEPIGWENQIANSFLVNYNLLYEHGILLMPWIEVIAQGGLKAGVLNTNGLLGVLTRIGKKRSYFGSTKRKQQNWELYGIVNGTATYIYYNAALQGVPMVKSVHVLQADKLERFVYKLNAGITFSVKRVSLTYSNTFITPEFKGGLAHGWGSCNLVMLF